MTEEERINSSIKKEETGLSRNVTQLWICQVVKVKSSAEKE